ncbi:MAG: type II and III secretion system protein [Ewingella americana]|uniref:type II and III secretion system protein n=1 Tax=Ewingella americana TaxID=41202 RepID=UPI000C2F8992|nr:type II and III secretion system protein [Ewingella americana]MCI1676575.1 type II and III secretion system protein [Ewingella americana]MCI1853835.1 type II and III secretion system protein [Ewingella americana]MCI1859924.1 type II and III secretion system protein [Ewingella americana]MCI2142252.1 type II and III secretion system protein [Ewingella americana]MCI2163215.1 type II and III secretion system protein [Ewingella americana]
MKNKLLILCLSAMLPGCAHYFDQKYDLKSEYNQMPQVVEADDIKTRPYQKYDAAFLGKRVEYNAKTQQLLSQNVNIESYEPIDLPTLLESVADQTGISYRINDSLPNSEKTGSQAAPLQAHSINFNGTFEEFMRYISVLYDVSSTLDHNNVLTTSLYETYAIKLDFYGQNNKFEASLDLSSNEATAEGGLIAKSETKFESTFWEDVKDMAEKYVSSGIYSLFKDASILTFTARPSEHKTLSQILKKYQTDNSRQFIVSYKVFVLDKRKIKKAGAAMNIDLINGGTGINLTTAMMKSAEGTFKTGRKFYSPEAGRTLNINAQLDAFYELTGSRVLQSGTFVTRNNVPIPLNMTKRQNYVSGRTRTINETTNRETIEVTTDRIITGTSFIITPRVLSDGRIEVSSGFTKRFLNGLDTFELIQLPVVTTTETFNVSTVTAGTLLMVSKYQATEMSDGQRAMLIGAGGESNQSDATVVMVVGIDYHQAPYSLK